MCVSKVSSGRFFMRVARGTFSVVALAIAVLAFSPLSNTLRAAPSGALLTGTVKGPSGEKMAGVTVSAKMEGQTITTSVFTDDYGDYYFPALDAGKYQVWAQADT